ncbi:MAG: flavodoxin-dependent (E)-4-hydroxy-3-methylbut-2-enyl-diphosphate synthase [Candidatus Hydrogenedentes bacterium]|nr:flavodoxin-dependent (E)-4-hydroxy-3-methylbut-2-enyl-diphosphate synthase [Candidatus Hydrogenedentota bacterium]
MKRRNTIPVQIGTVRMGGDAAIVVQAMTNTDSSDIEATTQQCAALAEAGAEMLRITVNTPRAAAAVPEIKARLLDAGVTAPLIGDFHYNGHKLLQDYPDCAEALQKYRINPGNVGMGKEKEQHFAAICRIARDLDKALRIGVNAGSLDGDLLGSMLKENDDQAHPSPPASVINRCMVLSTLQATEQALALGVREDRIVLSCKSSQPVDLIAVYRELATQTRQALHLGLTEAGLGMKGLIWSSAAMGVLLEEGIGDTIRVSLTPMPGGDRCEEVYAAQQLLQSLSLRQFAPTVTACPGCGRTASDDFQRLAADTEAYIRRRLPQWRLAHPGIESLRIAVMGCIVNGPGESRAAHIGISLPGNNEHPLCPIYCDGEKTAVLKGSYEEITQDFLAILESYVETRFPSKPKRESPEK